MADIIPFDFETNAVRIVMRDGAPWFVAADVCRVLEHGNPRQVISRLDDDERGVLNVDTLGGEQSLNIISESGLFALILTSRKPAAKRFRKWVTSEVLPAIRRGGSYGLDTQDYRELAGKREYYRNLPEHHRELADKRADVLRLMEEMIGSGSKVGQAAEAAAQQMGISVRSVWEYRRAVYMVAPGDQAAALAPKWTGRRGMMAECHPEAMRMFLDLCFSGVRVSDCYRRVLEVVEENGWLPIPTQRTMYRVGQRGGAPIGKVLVQPYRTMGRLSSKQEALLRGLGIDARGFDFSLDASAVNHIFNKHGNVAAELARGGRAITVDDLAQLAGLLDSPLQVQAQGASLRSGLPLVQFSFRVGAEEWFAVFERRAGRKMLALTTFYIKR